MDNLNVRKVENNTREIEAAHAEDRNLTFVQVGTIFVVTNSSLFASAQRISVETIFCLFFQDIPNCESLLLQPDGL